MALLLAQQGQFQQFALLYCCMLPLGFFAALGLVYFGIRVYVRREEERALRSGRRDSGALLERVDADDADKNRDSDKNADK